MKLGSKGCWRIGQWIAKLLLAVAPVLLPPCANAAEPDEPAGPASTTQTSPQHEGAIHITRAELLSVVGTGYTPPPQRLEDAKLPADGWRAIGLPHKIGRAHV